MDKSNLDGDGSPQKSSSHIPTEYQKCCVCTGDNWKSEAKYLHPIPNHNAVVQMRWFSFIRRTRGSDWTPKDDNNIPLVCSLHFTSRSYLPSSEHLKPNVVPFVDVKQSKNTTSSSRKRRRNSAKDANSRRNSSQEMSQTQHEGEKVDAIPIIQPYKPKTPHTHKPKETLEQNLTSLQPLSNPDEVVNEGTRKNKRLRKKLVAPNPNVPCVSEKQVENEDSTLILTPIQSSTIQLLTTPQEPVQPQLFCISPVDNLNQPLTFQASMSNIPPTSHSNCPLNVSSESMDTTKTVFVLPSQPTILPLGIQSLQNIPGNEIKSPFLLTLENILPAKTKLSETIPMETNFCLICGHILNPLKEIPPDRITKGRRILLSLLNINAEEMNEKYPVCDDCNNLKVLSLQSVLDKLIKIQKELEQQRNNLIQEIVRTFCVRFGQHQAGLNFVTANAVHELITKKWASMLRPPYEKNSAFNCDLDLVGAVVAERKFKKLESRRKNDMKRRLDREAKLLQTQQKKQERRRLLEEARERRKRGEKKVKSRSWERTQCPICQLELQKLSLRKHMLIHNSEAVHKCNVCDKTFLRADSLRNHSYIHKIGDVTFGQADRNFQCPHCDMIVPGGKKYFQHVADNHLSSGEAQVDSSFFYDCDADNCTLSICNLNEFREHLLTHSEAPVICTCGKQFALPSNLILHESTHEGREEGQIFYDCGYCKRYFNSEHELKNHQFLHQIRVDPQAFKFICEQCGAKFLTQVHLLSHRSSHDKPQVRLGGEKRKYQLFICEVCGTKFNAETRLKMHAYEHTHPEGFLCDRCQQVFPNPTKLWFHRRRNKCNMGSSQKSRPGTKTIKASASTNAGASEESESVDNPGKPNNDSNKPMTVVSHVERSCAITETKQKKNDYPCKHCNVILKNLYIHRRHNLVFHPDIYMEGKPFVCPVCWKNFTLQDQLDEHCRTQHDKSKCKVCNKQFPGQAKLEQHLRTHTGEKPYKCQYCAKCFNLETNLKEHEFRHTGNRPYGCSYCDSGFFRKKQLQQHLEKVHPDEQGEVQVEIVATTDTVASILEPSPNSESHCLTIHNSESRDSSVIIDRESPNPLIDFSNFVVNF